MKILGIETSCDETAASVVEDGTRVLSTVVQTQIDIHAVYGGVVPEVAARSHIEVVLPVIQQALDEAQCSWNDIDAIGVTYAPGLVGSLLIGSLAARTIALLRDKPLYAVHHVEGHVYANFITEQQLKTPLTLPALQPRFPLLALIVSGGHSQLALFHGHGDYKLLGQTQDDAVGEAFDKVAKIIGLPYPGGPSIAKAAESGDAHRFTFPKARMDGVYDFSFSGLKTAVLRTVQRECGVDHTFPSHQLPERVTDELRADIAASFQRVAIETLVDKTLKAFHEHSPASVVIAGGVAANQELRRQLTAALPISIEYAPMSLCTDNATMIASLAYYMSQSVAPVDPRQLDVIPSLSMTKTAWASHA
ncbi:MAG: tRNA (adenosine(37)-N6)-threonylcarbamoyltransferase complex transferase subunit TsaD [Candidatus Saccharimonadales bacterium]